MKKTPRPHTAIRIRKDLKDEAKKRGLNISSFVEFSLDKYLTGNSVCPACGVEKK